MNPNSKNQRWSKWTITIVPSGVKRPGFEDVKLNAARFGRALFRSASSMRVQHLHNRALGSHYVIEVLTEGTDVHDPEVRARVQRQWRDDFAIKGFGKGTRVHVEGKLMAGSREDGTPADQMIIAPSVPLPTREIKL